MLLSSMFCLVRLVHQMAGLQSVGPVPGKSPETCMFWNSQWSCSLSREGSSGDCLIPVTPVSHFSGNCVHVPPPWNDIIHFSFWSCIIFLDCYEKIKQYTKITNNIADSGWEIWVRTHCLSFTMSVISLDRSTAWSLCQHSLNCSEGKKTMFHCPVFCKKCRDCQVHRW